MKKTTNAKKTAKPAKAVKPVAATVDTTAGTAKAVANTMAENAKAHYDALNTAFLSKYNKRPIFGEKRPTAIDLTKHNPTTATERDNAFIHALRTVYGEKPFALADLRVDTGNIARAIKLGMLQSLGIIDGGEQFKCVSNRA